MTLRQDSGYNVAGRMMAASLYYRLAFKDARHLILDFYSDP